MTVCGIDPGLSGGITFMKQDSSGKVLVKSYGMPTMRVGKKERLDLAAIQGIIRMNKPDKTCVEQVWSRPGQSITAMFNFGFGAGALEGILAALYVPYTLVIPQTWMKAVLLGLPKDKTKKDSKPSIIWCQRMFPHVDWRATPNCRKPHDGKTDSACIAYYALKK